MQMLMMVSSVMALISGSWRVTVSHMQMFMAYLNILAVRIICDFDGVDSLLHCDNNTHSAGAHSELPILINA
jgi:hypothetical protein